MGEYATDGTKIGTCEMNYYVRLEDHHKLTPARGSGFGWFWRVPFLDEDNLQVGSYENYKRGALLTSEFAHKIQDDTPGTIQLNHPCGLLASLPCYHGHKLPEVKGARLFWNGRAGSFFELIFIKKKLGENKPPYPTVRCRFCNTLWTFDNWDEVLPYLIDKELKLRLSRLYVKN